MERENNGGKGREWKYVSHFHTPTREVENTIPSHTQEAQKNWYNRPHEELVGIIKSAIVQTRKEYKARGWEFDPVFWLGEHVAITNSSFAPTPYEKTNHPLRKLVRAYQAISSPYIKDAQTSAAVRGWAIDDAEMHGNIITLDLPMVRLLDAMTGAVGIPRTREQTTVDQLEYINLYRQDGDPLPRNIADVITPREQETATIAQFTDARAPVTVARYRRFGTYYVDTRKAQPIMADWWNNIRNTWDNIPTKT
jgi:hypothetical protein